MCEGVFVAAKTTLTKRAYVCDACGVNNTPKHMCLTHVAQKCFARRKLLRASRAVSKRYRAGPNLCSLLLSCMIIGVIRSCGRGVLVSVCSIIEKPFCRKMKHDFFSVKLGRAFCYEPLDWGADFNAELCNAQLPHVEGNKKIYQ